MTNDERAAFWAELNRILGLTPEEVERAESADLGFRIDVGLAQTTMLGAYHACGRYTCFWRHQEQPS